MWREDGDKFPPPATIYFLPPAFPGFPPILSLSLSPPLLPPSSSFVTAKATVAASAPTASTLSVLPPPLRRLCADVASPSLPSSSPLPPRTCWLGCETVQLRAQVWPFVFYCSNLPGACLSVLPSGGRSKSCCAARLVRQQVGHGHADEAPLSAHAWLEQLRPM